MTDIMNAVMLVVARAEEFIEAHPEHTEENKKFVQELTRMAIELKSAVYGKKKL